MLQFPILDILRVASYSLFCFITIVWLSAIFCGVWDRIRGITPYPNSADQAAINKLVVAHRCRRRPRWLRWLALPAISFLFPLICLIIASAVLPLVIINLVFLLVSARLTARRFALCFAPLYSSVQLFAQELALAYRDLDARYVPSRPSFSASGSKEPALG